MKCDEVGMRLSRNVTKQDATKHKLRQDRTRRNRKAIKYESLYIEQIVIILI